MTLPGRTIGLLALSSIVLLTTACAGAGVERAVPTAEEAAGPIPALAGSGGSLGGHAAREASEQSPSTSAEPAAPTDTSTPAAPGCDELLSPATYDRLREDPLIEPLYELAGLHADWAPHAVLLDDEDDRLCLWGERNTDYSIWYGIGAVDSEDVAFASAALIEDGYTQIADERGTLFESSSEEGPYGGSARPYLFTPDGRLLHASTAELLDDLYERSRSLG